MNGEYHRTDHAGLRWSFSLIKADSGTGNFVKIAQRIAVRITFDPDQKELARLSPGMSVEARLDTQQAGQQR